ncbi:MAG TPA: hypothetical protein VFW11_10860 [Cyclobacteriaceae bacterium]|nr:hypothetical protein [Cyclobacteriaceae bacterium]
MKKITLILAVILMAFSCSETESLKSNDPHDITASFPKEYLTVIENLQGN